MLSRKQIMVPADVDSRIRRLARLKGVSQSALIVEAVRAFPEPDQQLDRILGFAGVIDGPETALSEHVDDIVYGR